MMSETLDFEVYLLVTMKYGMLGEEAHLAAKLAEHGLTFEDAEHIHQRIAALFNDESTRFERLRHLVFGAAEDRDSRSLTYRSVLWPDFGFTATVDDDGGLESAQYRRLTGTAKKAASPREQQPWSMDLSDFADAFGPVTSTDRRPFFDKILPAYEGREFAWGGRDYGAAFSWGLFLHASILWD